jgi:hypothetical protein
MQYIVTVKHTTTNTSITQRTLSTCTHLVDATDEANATSKINTYYTAMNSGTIEHTADVISISTLIS